MLPDTFSSFKQFLAKYVMPFVESNPNYRSCEIRFKPNDLKFTVKLKFIEGGNIQVLEYSADQNKLLYHARPSTLTPEGEPHMSAQECIDLLQNIFTFFSHEGIFTDE